MDQADTVAPAAVPRLLRHSTLYFVGNAASRVVGLVMIPFYTSQLSTAEYGILNLMELATTIVTIVFGLQSIGDTLTRIYHDQKEAPARRQVVSTAFIAVAVVALAAGGLAVLLARPIAGAINLAAHVDLLRVSFVAMVFSTLAEMVLVYYRIRERARFYLTYNLIALFVTLSLNIWFIGFLHFGVWGFVSSKLVVTGAGSLVLGTLMLREVGVHWAPHHARALARFGWPLVVSSASFFAIHLSDRLFLAQISQADVGVYSLSYNFAFLLSVLVGDSFGRTWNATFYSYASGAGWQQRFARIGAWLIFVLGAAALGISLFGRDTLRIIVPHDYLPPLLMLPVLVFGYFFREVGDFFRNMLLIDSGSGLVGRIAVGGAIVNLCLNWLLITGPAHLGIWGAALSTAMTWILYCAVCWIMARRQHRFSFRVSPMLVLLAISAGCLALRFAAPAGNAWLGLAMDAGCFALFMAMTALLYLDSAQRMEAFEIGQQAYAKIKRVLF